MLSYTDIEQAYQRIRHMVVKTPLLTSDRLNDKLGFRLFIKAEPLQRIGALNFGGPVMPFSLCQRRRKISSPFQVATTHRQWLLSLV